MKAARQVGAAGDGRGDAGEAELQAGLQKIGAGVGVAVAGSQHGYRLAVVGAQVGFIEVLVLPDVVEEIFAHNLVCGKL